MLIGYSDKDAALTAYFQHHFMKKRVGLVTCITGGQFLKTGTGKSYTALKIGDENDKDFSIDKVVYYPRDFLRVMDLIEEKGKPGQVAVVDEGEITAPASMWYSFTNKAIGYNLATFRYLRCMSIFVTPAFSWLDKRVRILTNHLGFCEKFVETGGAASVNLRLYRLKTDLFGEKIFLNKITMYNMASKQMTSFKRFKVGLPRQDLIDEYEKKSMEFKKSLRKGLIKEAERFERYQLQKSEGKEGAAKVKLSELLPKALDSVVIRGELEERGRVTNSTLANEFEEAGLTTFETDRLRKLVNNSWSGKA